MTDVLYTIGSGLISGAFAAGVMWATVRSVGRRVHRVEGKIDKHISEHAKGAFNVWHNS